MAKKTAKKPCSVEGCGRTRVAKGLCSKCYREKYGKSYTPKQHRAMPPITEPTFAEVVKKQFETINPKDTALKITITELSNRCIELSNENTKLKEDLELAEYSYNVKFNEMEIEILRVKATVLDYLIQMSDVGVR